MTRPSKRSYSPGERGPPDGAVFEPLYPGARFGYLVCLRTNILADAIHMMDGRALTPRRRSSRWGWLMAGLFGCGLSIALMIRSQLGLGPWDAFHVGLHRITGLTVGTVSILVGLAIICGTRFMGVRPGAGTLVNMVMIGVFIDLLLPVVPIAPGVVSGLAYYAVALIVFGLATGLYLAAGLGSGPRDGLMIGLADRTGMPVRRIRTLVELLVLAAGWAMGGRVGFGTVLFAFTGGPAMQWGMQLFGLIPGRRATATSPVALVPPTPPAPPEPEGDRQVA